MNIVDEEYVSRLAIQCAVRKNISACKILDLYTAIAQIAARLKRELDSLVKDEAKDLLDIKPPLGPEPDPPPELEDLLASGDPDGAPARIFSTVELSSNKERLNFGLQAAKRLRGALDNVISDLDKNIIELEQSVAK